MAPRILIAEDDRLQGKVLQAALQGRGYETELVADGLAAIQALRTGQYEIGLIDYHMPVVDGLAAARLMQDFVGDRDRPRLIALTAAAAELHDKQDGGVGQSFDAVVSKLDGMPGLFASIEANLSCAFAAKCAVAAQGEIEQVQFRAQARKRRLAAPLAAIPALLMVGAFLAASAWVVGSLHDVGAAAVAARQEQTLAANATDLVSAVQDAEVSQKTFLATGQQRHQEEFQAAEQRIDRLLTSPMLLTAEATPGMAAEGGPQNAIENRLQALAEAAKLRPVLPVQPPADAAGLGTGRDTAERLRGWAANVVSGTQHAITGSLAGIAQTSKALLVILAAGIAYAMYNAAAAVRRKWVRAAALPPERPQPFRPDYRTIQGSAEPTLRLPPG